MFGPLLFEEVTIANLEFFKLEARGYCTAYQAMALRRLTFSGEPTPSRNHCLETRALMPQGIAEPENTEPIVWLKDIDSNWHTIIKMPHLVRPDSVPG